MECWVYFFMSGELICAVIITMSTLLLVFFSKIYTVGKMVLRAVGLSFQQLPCLPFGTLGTCEYLYTVQAAPLHVSPPPLCPRLATFLSRPLEGDPKDGHYGQRAHKEMCPGLAP